MHMYSISYSILHKTLSNNLSITGKLVALLVMSKLALKLKSKCSPLKLQIFNNPTQEIRRSKCCCLSNISNFIFNQQQP